MTHTCENSIKMNCQSPVMGKQMYITALIYCVVCDSGEMLVKRMKGQQRMKAAEP